MGASDEEKKPPAWATRILSWYCRAELLEDLQGDLAECFQRNVSIKGFRRAQLIYVIDVIKFCKPYLIRKPDSLHLFIQWIMIGSYLKSSGRSIVRNKLFSAINIIGLAISMSVGLLMISMLSDFYSYDQFHKNKKRIFRLISNYDYLDHKNESYCASTSFRAGDVLAESIPEAGPVAILARGMSDDVKAGEKTVLLSSLWSNTEIFKVFTFQLVEGNPATALANPYTVVLTEKAAITLFGTTQAMGKTIELSDKKEYVVTGIIKDVPKFSHLRFDLLVSLSTTDVSEKGEKITHKWDDIWNHYVYFLLPEKTTVKQLQARLDVLSRQEDKSVPNTQIHLGLQPLNKIALGEELNNSIGPVMPLSVIWIIGILSLVVIMSACFNYTNLSIARSIRRSREVGIRKVIGARRSHVLGQFITEAVVIALLALLVAFLLFLILKPYFLSINPTLPKMLELSPGPIVILCFILLAATTGFFAGILPAIFFARINAVTVLKDASSLKLFGNINMRKLLIVIQYTISISFIATTIIGYKQYKHFLNFDLGYQTSNIINISLQHNKAAVFEKELTEMSEVEMTSHSQMITSVGSYWGTYMKYKNTQDSTVVFYNKINENYLPLHGHKLLAGRNFIGALATKTEDEVIVNEEVLAYFKIGGKDPIKAIGATVTVDKKPMQIIGVLKNFYYGRPNERDVPKIIFRYTGDDPGYINAKINSSNLPETMEKIEKAWKKMDDVHPLDATFYDQQIARAYGEYSAMLKVIGFLAGLAVCIASLGLLGMVVFMTETRVKEIGIRKVLGASEGNLILLLGKGFMVLLLISGAIALPVTWFFFDRYILHEMANRAPIKLQDLLVGLVAVMAIASIMIGSLTMKVARANPAEVLKSE